MDNEFVAVTYGEEVFCPRPYHSFRVGPFSMTTKVKEGETPEQAMQRAYNALTAFARESYKAKRADFFVHFNDMEGF